MAEKYLNWYPIKGLPFPIDLEDMRKNELGLTISLYSEDKSDQYLQINFPEYEAVKEISDEFKIKLWHEADIDEDYAFFIVENSEWLEAFHRESENQFRDLKIIHYAIWTTENWIDVLSSTIPNLKWINKCPSSFGKI